jgi:hypothetical protein
MAKFSIKDAIEYGVRTYMQHIVLMLCVGATVGLAQWGVTGAPRLVADQLGIKSRMVSPADMKKGSVHPAAPVEMHPEQAPAEDASKMAKIHHHLKEAGKRIHHVVTEKAYSYAHNSPTNLITLFLVWAIMILLSLLVSIGLIRVTLDIVDKNTSSYQRLFSQRALMFPWVGLVIVYIFFIMVIAIGAVIAGMLLGGALAFALNLLIGEAGGVIGGIVGAVTMIAISFKFMTRYIFAFYCLVDKKMGIHEALTCTRAITKGSVVKLIAFMLVVTLPFMFGGGIDFHMRIGKHMFADKVHSTIIAQIILGLITPLYALCIVHVYRKLSRG